MEKQENPAGDPFEELLRGAVAKALNTLIVETPDGYTMVPIEPTEKMWSGLARDIMTWAMFMDHKGSTLHAHLKELGHEIPDWLVAEIPDNQVKATKGSAVVAVYRAMLQEM